MSEASERGPIVFVPTRSPKFEQGLEYAREFGELIDLCIEGGPKVNPFKTHEAISIILRRLDEVDFDGDRDFVAVTGGAILVTLVALAAYERSEGVKLLLFDAVNSRYVERTILPATLTRVGA